MGIQTLLNLFGLVKDTCLEKHLPLILAETLVFGMQPLLTLYA